MLIAIGIFGAIIVSILFGLLTGAFIKTGEGEKR